jgi:hypothetical protein
MSCHYRGLAIRGGPELRTDWTLVGFRKGSEYKTRPCLTSPTCFRAQRRPGPPRKGRPSRTGWTGRTCSPERTMDGILHLSASWRSTSFLPLWRPIRRISLSFQLLHNPSFSSCSSSSLLPVYLDAVRVKSVASDPEPPLEWLKKRVQRREGRPPAAPRVLVPAAEGRRS